MTFLIDPLFLEPNENEDNRSLTYNFTKRKITLPPCLPLHLGKRTAVRGTMKLKCLCTKRPHRTLY